MMNARRRISAFAIAALATVFSFGAVPDGNVEISDEEVTVYQARQLQQCKHDAKNASDSRGELLCDCIFDRLRVSMPRKDWIQMIGFAKQKKLREELEVMTPYVFAEMKACSAQRN